MLGVCTCKATLCYWAMSNNSPDFWEATENNDTFCNNTFRWGHWNSSPSHLASTNKRKNNSFLTYYNIRQKAQLLQCQEEIIWHAVHTKQFGTRTRTANSVSANDECPSNWTSFKRWGMKLNVGNVVQNVTKTTGTSESSVKFFTRPA